jgi:predicted component of type VI protein secretion system
MPVPASPTGAYLVALTPEASEAIRAQEMNIPYVPFRVGRESRQYRWKETGLVGERRSSDPPNNDLYLTERDDIMNVSREHFQIERDATGFFLLDRGSACGTLVEGRLAGHGADPRQPLADHDVIIVGASGSKFVFKLRLESHAGSKPT